MDPNKQIAELRNELQTLRTELDLMKAAADLDPDKVRAMALAIFQKSAAAVTSYDQSVNEAGASAYTVPKIQDGHFSINGKLVPFYNP